MAAAASPPALSEETLASYIEVFKSFDMDSSGTIEPHELIRILNKVGIKKSPKEVGEIIKEVDYNGDGEINFVEFTTMLHLMSSGPTTDEDLDAIFDKFAGKHLMVAPDDGMSRKDLSLACKAYAETMEDSEIDAIFEGAGVKGNELMSREQFRSVFRATLK